MIVSDLFLVRTASQREPGCLGLLVPPRPPRRAHRGAWASAALGTARAEPGSRPRKGERTPPHLETHTTQLQEDPMSCPPEQQQ